MGDQGIKQQTQMNEELNTSIHQLELKWRPLQDLVYYRAACDSTDPQIFVVTVEIDIPYISSCKIL